MSASVDLYQKACEILPGGVNSPVRAFKSVGGTPPFVVSAKGCYLKDSEGKVYIDYIGSWGPMILGHTHDIVTTKIQEAAASGTSFGAPSPLEVELAEEIIKRIDSIEKIRFVNSGTEATMSAIRLARAATEREVIIKFAGGYHGHADSFLIQAGSGAITFGVPNSPGVTAGSAKDTRIAKYNNLESVENLFKSEPDKIAAIIIEPVAGNMGVIPPEPGFLQGLRDLCDKYGALLIFDEVMTGFRVHPKCAQGLYNIKPDLTTFGKIIGGGLPVGAYGGRNDLMSQISPEGPVYQAGTLSGNPLAMIAGLSTIQLLNEEVYANIEKTSSELEAGINHIIKKTGIEAIVQRVGSMLTIFFATGQVKNFEDAANADHQKFGKFFNGMLKRGIHLPPSGYEAWFISAAHNSDTNAVTLKAIEESFVEL